MTRGAMDPIALAASIRPVDLPCVQAVGHLTAHGYRVVSVGGRQFAAHRMSYLLFHGSIPFGFQIDHLCHNADLSCSGGTQCIHRGCIEPTHLEAVTPRLNVLRGHTRVGAQARQTHCKRGHELTPENCYARPDGQSYRVCISCTRLREAKRRRGPRKNCANPSPRDAFCPCGAVAVGPGLLCGPHEDEAELEYDRRAERRADR